jgi:hypothetical protein
MLAGSGVEMGRGLLLRTNQIPKHTHSDLRRVMEEPADHAVLDYRHRKQELARLEPRLAACTPSWALPASS